MRTRTYKAWDPEDPVRTWIINHGTHAEDLALYKTWVPGEDPVPQNVGPGENLVVWDLLRGPT